MRNPSFARPLGGRIFSALIAASLISLSLALLAPNARAESPISLLAPDDPTLKLTAVDTQAGTESGVFRVIVQNSSAADLNSVTLSGAIASTSASCSSDVQVSPRSPIRVAKFSVAPADVNVSVKTGCVGQKGLLIAKAGNLAPTTLIFGINRDVKQWQYWVPLWASGLLALALVVIAVVARWSTLKDTTGLGPSWSFNSSWLTNISAFGAAVAATLSLSGLLDHILPGVDTIGFLGLNLIFAAMILAGPLIYAGFSKWAYSGAQPSSLGANGRVIGTILAAGATVWGSLGQLGVVALVSVTSNSESSTKTAVLILLGVGAIIMVVYAASFVVGATRLQAQAPTVPSVAASSPVSGTL